jgi:hypothetical protein
MTIERNDGERVEATYVRHLRTLTHAGGCDGSANIDLDLFRLADGREIVCESPANDGRAVPVEFDITREAAMKL